MTCGKGERVDDTQRSSDFPELRKRVSEHGPLNNEPVTDGLKCKPIAPRLSPEGILMPLEDDFCDIVKKARTGQGLSVADVARTTGLPAGDLMVLERGGRSPTKAEVRTIATDPGR